MSRSRFSPSNIQRGAYSPRWVSGGCACGRGQNFFGAGLRPGGLQRAPGQIGGSDGLALADLAFAFRNGCFLRFSDEPMGVLARAVLAPWLEGRRNQPFFGRRLLMGHYRTRASQGAGAPPVFMLAPARAGGASPFRAGAATPHPGRAGETWDLRKLWGAAKSARRAPAHAESPAQARKNAKVTGASMGSGGRMARNQQVARRSTGAGGGRDVGRGENDGFLSEAFEGRTLGALRRGVNDHNLIELSNCRSSHRGQSGRFHGPRAKLAAPGCKPGSESLSQAGQKDRGEVRTAQICAIRRQEPHTGLICGRGFEQCARGKAA